MMKPDFLREVMEINFNYLLKSQDVLQKSFFNENMSIVGISSIASVQGIKVKQPIVHLRQHGCQMHGKRVTPKIRVNSVMPGLIKPIYRGFR